MKLENWSGPQHARPQGSEFRSTWASYLFLWLIEKEFQHEGGEEEKASIRRGQSRLPHRPASGMGYGSVISSLTRFKLSIATQPSMLRTGPGGICSHTVVSGTQTRKSRSRMRHSILGTQTSASHLLPSAGHRLCVNLSQHARLVGWDPQAI